MPRPANKTASRQAAVQAFVAIGANLGDAGAAVLRAIEAIGLLPGTRLRRASSLYRTAPVDAAGPDFINAVAEVETHLAPHELLSNLQRIETDAGRERPYRNAPRTLDLDILLYGRERIDTPTLQVPHPRMTGRAFVLMPLQEIAPDRVGMAELHAVRNQRIERLAIPD